jgi:hypothetical protein
MAAKPKASGVLAVRSKQLFVSPPGTLGFSNLLEPDDAFDALKFNAQVHYSEAAQERLVALIEKDVVDANWAALMKEIKSAEKAEPKGGWVKPDARSWVEDKMKPPSERSKTQLPSIQWANEAEFRNKEGQLQRKTMRAYSAQGALLDLPSLHLGMGSIVQAVLIPGLFISPLMNRGQPLPSFKLQGLRIINLVQFGAGGGTLGDLDEADMALLGEDLEVSDLGSFAAAPRQDAAKMLGAVAKVLDKPRNDRGYSDVLDEDEIPF